jgi:hypothetical protein
MYTIHSQAQISAPVSRVWRALCDPAEVVRWDSGVVEALDAPPDYPLPGQHVRWRCHSGLFRLLHDRPLEVATERRLRSRLSLGPIEIDETYDLSEAPGGCLIHLAVELRVAVPFLGRLLESIWAGPQTRAGFEESLAGLKRHCEGGALGA